MLSQLKIQPSDQQHFSFGVILYSPSGWYFIKECRKTRYLKLPKGAYDQKEDSINVPYQDYKVRVKGTSLIIDNKYINTAIRQLAEQVGIIIQNQNMRLKYKENYRVHAKLIGIQNKTIFVIRQDTYNFWKSYNNKIPKHCFFFVAELLPIKFFKPLKHQKQLFNLKNQEAEIYFQQKRSFWSKYIIDGGIQKILRQANEIKKIKMK